jgi:hypothetical protein
MKTSTDERIEQHTYTIVLRCAESQIRIPTGGGILLSPVTSEYGNYEARILTRTDSVGQIKTPIPRELWVEITGPAPTLEIALNIASSTANEYLRQIAFASNAWHGLLDVHLAYESSPGCKDRVFFQNWVNDERGLPRAARTVDQHLVFRVLAGIAQLALKDRPRVVRAITQYSDALQHWKPGSELYALAHLYMGVEGITEAVIRNEVTKRHLQNRTQLERAVMSPSRRPLSLRFADWLYRRKTGHVPPAPLDNWARREIIFKGDEEAFKTARTASNKLEHGLAQHEEVHQLAVKCVVKCAKYLREAILSLIPLTATDRDTLSTEPYASPANTRGFDRQIFGAILCQDEEIAAADQAYPYVLWKVDLKEFTVAENGSNVMRVTQQLTPILGQSAKLRVSRIHFAGPSETTHEEVKISVDGKQGKEPVAGVDVSIDAPLDSRWVSPVGGVILNCNTVRHLSIHWILRLGRRGPETISTFAFPEAVETIKDLISRYDVPDALRNECATAWQEALELDEVRMLVADCASQPEGLIPVSQWSCGNAPLIGDIERLSQINARIVALAQRLVSLLDLLLRLPAFATPPADGTS